MPDLPRKPIFLWPESPLVEPDREQVLNQRVSLIENPAMLPFWPDAALANGAAVLIFPGGGYERVALGLEGVDVAQWLNSLGIVAFVVKYRLQEHAYPASLQDGLRAVRYVRAHAQEWQLDPARIGVMGFSAGGHVAASVSTWAQSAYFALPNDPLRGINALPDFMILGYPVITLEGGHAHSGCRTALFGKEPDPALVLANSLQHHVHKRIPPTFIFHGAGDKAVPWENSLMFFNALQKHRIASELHIYQTKQHGFGLGVSLESVSGWSAALRLWLIQNEVLSAAPT